MEEEEADEIKLETGRDADGDRHQCDGSSFFLVESCVIKICVLSKYNGEARLESDNSFFF
jgi:hypothetical protein